MKTYNVILADGFQLQAFCRSNGIDQAANVLVQVFSGICRRDYIEWLRSSILQALPQAKIIGATTASEIIDGRIIQNRCVLAISTFDRTAVRTAAAAHCGNDCVTAGRALAEKLTASTAAAMILFGDGLYTQGEDVLQGISSVAPRLIVAGGLAGDNDLLQRTFVFTELELLDQGVVGAALYGETLVVHTDYNFDWEPFGKPLRVTAAEGSCVQEIEGMTAVEVYRKYLGDEIADGLPHTGQEFPLMAERGGIRVSRPILDRLADGSLRTNATIRVGEELHFGYNNFKSSVESAGKLRRQLESRPLESMFIYNCTARLGFFKAIGVSETLPRYENVPVSGFFSYGEFSHLPSGNQFVCQTMTVLTLAEEKQARGRLLPDAENGLGGILLRGNKGLCNLIKITSDELANSNLELTAMNQELTAMNQELLAMSEELNDANQTLELVNRELDDTNRNLAREVDDRKTAQADLQRALDELKRAQEQMVRAEKMTALGVLVSGMAHEINTPLGVGITAASHLETVVHEWEQGVRNNSLEPALLDEYLQEVGYAGSLIRNNLQRVAELVSGVREAATKTTLEELRSVSLRTHIEELVRSLQTDAERKRHHIRMECNEQLRVMLSPGDINQIVGGLLVNSFLHAFDEGMIGEIWILVRRSEDQLQIEYGDNGKGMTADATKRIFEPFFTTRRGRGSLGLGLYGIYNLVTQKMAGTIRCTSKPGAGVQFFLQIPLCDGARQESALKLTNI